MIDLAIIAAGEGSRLKTEGIKVSKPMVNIDGIPLIKRIIDIAINNGITSISCIINENSNDLKDFLTKNKFPIPVKVIVKSTKSSLHSFYELSKIISPPFLLTTADSIFDENEFTTFIDLAMNNNEADAIFAVTDFIDDEKPLYVSVDEKLRIINFQDESEKSHFVSGGLYFFKKSIEEVVEEAVNNDVIRLRNFQRFLIKKGYVICAYPFSKIIDVDHVTDIKKAEEFLMNNMEIK